jgi:dihydropteroate synthase
MNPRPALRFKWVCRNHILQPREIPLVMGILNATPDSFSDGGRFLDPEAAVRHGRQLLADGADILDIGGESSRPGAQPVPTEEQLRRILPVIRTLAAEQIPISVDTTSAAVAEAALETGACIINDISAFSDPMMSAVCRRFQAGAVLMHMQGTPDTMQEQPVYTDVAAEVFTALTDRAGQLIAEGIAPAALTLDPGIGFGKTPEHNIALLQRLPELGQAGFPVLVGVSRKSLIGTLTGRTAADRLAGSLAAALFAARQGAGILRVHEVKETCDVLHVWNRLSPFK